MKAPLDLSSPARLCPPPKKVQFWKVNKWYFSSIPGLFVLSVPSLDLPSVVVGGSRAGKLDSLAVQRGISEQVTEILKELQQLVRGVLEDGQHLRGHHIVNNKE